MAEQLAQPLVSVLLPAYNCATTLADAVGSMTAQTLRDIEIVVVNDGSTDNTAAVLDQLAAADARIRVIHTRNQGIVDALNTAIAHARGEYVARMDGDDLSHPERLALQLAYLREHPRCVCVGSLFRLMNAHGQITSVQHPIRHFRQTDLAVFPPRVTTLPHPSIMMRRADLQAVGGYRHGFAHAEDYDLFLRLAERGELGIVQQALLDYRVHGGSLSAKNLVPQVDSALKALLCAMQRARGLGEPQWPEGSLPVSALTACLPDQRLASLMSIYRDIRVAEAGHGREGAMASLRSEFGLLRALLRQLPTLANDARYWSLAARVAKHGAKIALRRI